MEETTKSRSTYQKTWREQNHAKQFNTVVPDKLMDKLTVKLDRLGMTKKQWLIEKIKEELNLKD